MGPRAFAHQKSDFTGASSENRAVTFMTAFGNLFIFRGLTSSLPYMCVLIYVVYVCVRAPRTSLGSSCSCHILQLFIVGKWTLFFFFFFNFREFKNLAPLLIDFSIISEPLAYRIYKFFPPYQLYWNIHQQVLSGRLFLFLISFFLLNA